MVYQLRFCSLGICKDELFDRFKATVSKLKQMNSKERVKELKKLRDFMGFRKFIEIVEIVERRKFFTYMSTLLASDISMDSETIYIPVLQSPLTTMIAPQAVLKRKGDKHSVNMVAWYKCK